MSDFAKDKDVLISRQAAIDAIWEHLTKILENTDCDLFFQDVYKMAHRHLAELIQILPSAEPEQRWIPVTERKPDVGYRVIVTDFGYVGVSRWFDGRWYDIDGNTLKGVTAWMPLPEPWKGGEDGRA